MPEYKKKLIKVNRDKTGREISKQIAMNKTNGGDMTMKQVKSIYNGFLRAGVPYDKIRLLGSNPYQNYFTLKGIRDLEVVDIDDDEYWINKSEEVRDKLIEISILTIVLYK